MGTIVSQPLSGGSRKIRVQGQRMPKVFANLHAAFSLGAGESLERFMERVSMKWSAAAKPYLTKCIAQCWMQWCKADHHRTAEQRRCVLWSDEPHLSVWQSHEFVWVYGLLGVMFEGGKIMVWGCFSRVAFGPLDPVKRTLIVSAFWTISTLCKHLMALSCSNMTTHPCTKTSLNRILILTQ